LHDAAGGYRTSYVVAGCCSLVGAIVILSAGPAAVPDDEPVAALV
jgi:hypothetical protein